MPAKGKTNWNDFTKAELIRTIKKLDKRQTQLLNELARCSATITELTRKPTDGEPVKYPWESASGSVGVLFGGSMPNPFENLK